MIALVMLSGAEVFAAEDGVQLHYPEADVRIVLDVYSLLTGRKVWLDLTVYGAVSIQTEKRIPKAEAIELIRTTMLEKHGIEMREPNAKETFVTWSTDPKYKEAIEATRFGPKSRPAPQAPPGGRVRIIR